MDFVTQFATVKNFNIRPRTIFVEGNTDVQLFELAARLEKQETGHDLLDDKLAIVAAGDGNEGGTKGVCRELVSFKNMATVCLLPSGRTKYRFAGLFDNDRAGRQAISDIRKTDTSVLEYKDVFRLRPVMPLIRPGTPKSLQKHFDTQNERYNTLDWELEDLIPKSLAEYFVQLNPNALHRTVHKHDKTHFEWTRDGKAKLHQFVHKNAIHADLIEVIHVLRALRLYLGLNP